MSTTNTPITPGHFAAALPALPLSSLHAKAAELRNAIAHLLDSNVQLQDFADAGDRDCADAIRENEEVIARHEERIGLVRVEVLGRGCRWDGLEEGGKGGDGKEEGGLLNGEGAGGEGSGEDGGGGGRSRGVTDGRAGRLGDEELARRLRERMEEDEDEEGDGVHL